MVTKRHLRIAVLECDEPIGKTKEKYGGYGGLFKELLENGVERYPELYGEKAPGLEVSKFDVVNDMEAYPRLEDVDAILLTGSSESTPHYLGMEVGVDVCEDERLMCPGKNSIPSTATLGSYGWWSSHGTC